MDYQYKRKKIVVEKHVDNRLSVRTKTTTETKLIRDRLKSEKSASNDRTPLKDLSENPQHPDTYPRNKQSAQTHSKPEAVKANIFPPKTKPSSAKKTAITNAGTQTNSLQSKLGNSVKSVASSLRNQSTHPLNQKYLKPLTRPITTTSSAISVATESGSETTRKSIKHPQDLQKSHCPIPIQRDVLNKESIKKVGDSDGGATKFQESQTSFMISKDQTDINFDNVTMMARRLLKRQDGTQVKCSSNKENGKAESTRISSTVLAQTNQVSATVNKPITIISGNSSTFTKQHPVKRDNQYFLHKAAKKLQENEKGRREEAKRQLVFGTQSVSKSTGENTNLEDFIYLDTSVGSNTLKPDISNQSILKKSSQSSTSSSKSIQFQNVTDSTKDSRTRPSTPHHTKSASSLDSSCYESMPEDSIYQSYEGSENISPIKPNIFTTNCTLILSPGETKEVPKKTTLIHKMQQNKREKYDETTPYTLDIFVADYIEDILKYLLTINSNYTLKRDFLQNYNPCKESRSKILNWIIKMQKPLYLSTEQIFLITRLFDNILARAQIPKNMYQLVILTISWIVAKCYSAYVLPATKLLKMCANAYTPQQLLKMEMKIMKAFKFSFVMNDPGIFGTFYMNKLNIDSEHQVRFCVSYVLESFALCHLFSTFQSSELAAAALYLTLRCLYPSEMIYQRISGVLAYHHPTEIRDISELMYIQLQKISDPRCEIGEPFRKYSMLEMKKVSILLQSCIKQPMSY